MVEFYEFTASDVPQFVSFYEKYLNSGVHVGEDIAALFDAGEYFGIKAVCDGECAGFLTLMEGLSLTIPHPEVEREILALIGSSRFVTVDAFMISPKFREKGIGHALCERVNAQLLSKGVEMFVVEIWVYPDHSSPALCIYEKMGQCLYKKELPGFYSASSKYGILCPVCGSECRCGACMEVIRIPS